MRGVMGRRHARQHIIQLYTCQKDLDSDLRMVQNGASYIGVEPAEPIYIGWKICEVTA